VLSGVTAAQIPFTDNPLVAQNFPLWQWSALRVIGSYLLLLLWPAELSADYSYDQVALCSGSLATAADLAALASLLVVLGSIGVAAWQWRRRRAVAWSIVFFHVALFPVSNLALRIGTIMAERFLYLPLVGFAACLACAVARGLRPLVSRLPRSGVAAQMAWAALCVVLCLPYVARTATRNRDWRDSVTLFRATIETSPHSYKAHNAYAASLYRAAIRDDALAERIPEIVEVGERALDIVAGLPWERRPVRPMINVGRYYEEQIDLLPEGAPERAELAARAVLVYDAALPAGWRDAIAADPSAGELPEGWSRDFRLYRGMARAALRVGRIEEASWLVRQAARLAPTPAVLFAMSEVEEALGDREAAAVAALRALLVDAEFDPAWRQLESLLAILAPDAPGLTREDGSPQLAVDSPLVLGILERACASQHRAFLASGRAEEAEAFREEATEHYRCPAELFAPP
jgi:hypothetical protein